MPFQLGFSFWTGFADLKNRARMRRWMGAGCALAMMCGCGSLRSVLAQDSVPSSKTSSTASPAKTQTKTQSKTQTKTAPGNKAHAASHPAAGTHAKSNTAVAAHGSKSKYAASRKNGKKKTARGQQKIEPERAQAIQEALIREHYLSGEAAGTWNQSSEDAMRRYQADHGWQSKTVPDARALISLGLGPSNEHLLNPESAMTTGPFTPRAASLTPVSHSADAGANANPAAPAQPATSVTPDHDTASPQ